MRDAITNRPFYELPPDAESKPPLLAAFIFCHECGAEGPTIEKDCFNRDDVLSLRMECDAAWNSRNKRNVDLYLSANECGLTVPSIHTMLTPSRDKFGHWYHPGLLEPADGREAYRIGEFEKWLEINGLQHGFTMPPNFDDLDDSCASWEPEPPEGEGWYIAMIHDSEDCGHECLWLRKITD